MCAEYHSGGDILKHIREIERVLNGRSLAMSWGGSGSEDAVRDEYWRKGFRITEPGVTGPETVGVGIDAVYSLLKSGRLKIFDSCLKARAQFQSYAYEMGPDGVPVANKIKNQSEYHILDTVRYFAVSVTTARPIKDLGRRVDAITRI
jgi:hypothetical protein